MCRANPRKQTPKPAASTPISVRRLPTRWIWFRGTSHYRWTSKNDSATVFPCAAITLIPSWKTMRISPIPLTMLTTGYREHEYSKCLSFFSSMGDAAPTQRACGSCRERLGADRNHDLAEWVSFHDHERSGQLP